MNEAVVYIYFICHSSLSFNDELDIRYPKLHHTRTLTDVDVSNIETIKYVRNLITVLTLGDKSTGRILSYG